MPIEIVDSFQLIIKLSFDSLWKVSPPPLSLMAWPDVGVLLEIEGDWTEDLGESREELLVEDVDVE